MRFILAGLLALAPALHADVLTLKDGQSATGEVASMDQYFLDFKNAQGTLFHLPWAEVRGVSHTATTRSWLEDNLITPYPAEVASRIEAASPVEAQKASLWPGLALHGWGHRAAGDTDRFYALAGAEAFGLLMGGFGIGELAGDDKPGETKITAQTLAVAGVGMFVGSFLYDVVFAPRAAEQLNAAAGLAPAPRAGRDYPFALDLGLGYGRPFASPDSGYAGSRTWASAGHIAARWRLHPLLSAGVDTNLTDLVQNDRHETFMATGALARLHAPRVLGLEPYLEAGVGHNLFADTFGVWGWKGGTQVRGALGLSAPLGELWSLDAAAQYARYDAPATQVLSARLGLSLGFGLPKE